MERRRDDLYDLELVVETAYKICHGAAGTFESGISILARPGPPRDVAAAAPQTASGVAAYLRPIKEEVDTLRQDIVAIKDTMNLNKKQVEENHQQLMKAVTQKTTSQPPSGGYGNNYTTNNRSSPPMANNQGGDRGGCWFCGGEHFATSCNDRTEYIRTGKLVIKDQKYLLPNGNGVTKTPGQTWKQRVDEQSGTADPLRSAHMFDSFFEVEAPRSSSGDLVTQFNQLKMEMESIKSRGLDMNSQGNINAAYQPVQSSSGQYGTAPAIQRRDHPDSVEYQVPSGQFAHSRAANTSGF